MQDQSAPSLSAPVDDRRAHFIVTIAEACDQARLGRMRVELVTNSGHFHAGVPRTRAVWDGDEDEFAGTGYARELGVGADVVQLDHIVELHLIRP